MTIPAAPWVFQVAWVEPGLPSHWEQDNVNYPGCIQHATLTRNSFHQSIRLDTLSITCLDANAWAKPLKASSPLYPNVRRGKFCRLLAQQADLSFKCAFFGPIANIASDSSRRNRPLVTFEVDSPMAAILAAKFTLPTLDNPMVWDPGAAPADTALGALLIAAQLGNSALIDVDPVGLVRVGGTWGGGAVTFGEALGQLIEIAGVTAYVEFLMPPDDGNPHWRFRWTQPLPGATPDITWSWLNGELEAKPTIKYTTEAAH